MIESIEVRRYLTADGRDVVGTWLQDLADTRAKLRIIDRLDRLALGTLGDQKSLGHGIHELRIDTGPGYRIYFARVGRVCVLLLAGGDKRKQRADIRTALERLNDYKKRSHQYFPR
jgi:putative addiction module killer protein